MAQFQKTLTAVNDEARLGTANEENGALSFQIPTGAVGTYVLEATLDTQAVKTNWTAIQFTNLATGALVTSASAPGIYFANYVGFTAARVRKTVGSAPENITIALNDE